MLSTDAIVHTKPQLEIFADDVKFSHGATIGQLDIEKIYYLRTRGISEYIARKILVDSFADLVFQKILTADIKNIIKDLL